MIGLCLKSAVSVCELVRQFTRIRRKYSLSRPLRERLSRNTQDRMVTLAFKLQINLCLYTSSAQHPSSSLLSSLRTHDAKLIYYSSRSTPTQVFLNVFFLKSFVTLLIYKQQRGFPFLYLINKKYTYIHSCVRVPAVSCC